MALLIGMSGPVKGQTFALNKDRTILGRNASNDIVVADEAVSSQHCYIARRGDRYVLRDLNSTNGTMLNLKRVDDEIELAPKQTIQVGSCEFLFDDQADNITSTSVVAPVTQVIVDQARPVINPTFFASVSPFGSRRKSNRLLWRLLLAGIGLAALVSLVVFLVQISN